MNNYSCNCTAFSGILSGSFSLDYGEINFRLTSNGKLCVLRAVTRNVPIGRALKARVVKGELRTPNRSILQALPCNSVNSKSTIPDAAVVVSRCATRHRDITRALHSGADESRRLTPT